MMRSVRREPDEFVKNEHKPQGEKRFSQSRRKVEMS
jgi:hypothetical protein